MRVSGSKTCSMARGKKTGSMEAAMRASTLRVPRMEEVITCGPTEVATRVNGSRTRLQALANTFGPMAEYMLVSG